LVEELVGGVGDHIDEGVADADDIEPGKVGHVVLRYCPGSSALASDR
jgi:hypothetical protein